MNDSDPPPILKQLLRTWQRSWKHKGTDLLQSRSRMLIMLIEWDLRWRGYWHRQQILNMVTEKRAKLPTAVLPKSHLQNKADKAVNNSLQPFKDWLDLVESVKALQLQSGIRKVVRTVVWACGIISSLILVDSVFYPISPTIQPPRTYSAFAFGRQRAVFLPQTDFVLHSPPLQLL